MTGDGGAGVQGGTLHLGDALAVLPTLESGSVSAIVTDPPYGQTNESYDGPIAFNPALWRECFRVAAPNAALLSFAGSPTYHRIASAIEAGGWKVRQMWGWVYRDGLITSAYPREGFDRLAPAFTPICYATKGKVLLPLKREGQPWRVRFRKQQKHPEMSERSQANHCRETAEGRWPRSLISDGAEPFEYFTLSHNAMRDGRSGHPNQKPLALMRWLLSKLPPGGVVLDPFAGSGSTLLAAAAEGFRAVGIERDPAYHEMARKRIEAQPQELFA